MEQGGIYTWWYSFRKGQVGGQVATIITLAIAVIFLFVAVTLNISRVAQRKTATAKAADGAVIKLASSIGSYANQLSWKYLDGGTKKTKRRSGTFWKILAAVVSIILFAMTGNPVFLYTAIASGISAGLNEFVFEPKIASRIQRQLSKLSLGLNLSEQAVMQALRSTVDDPAKVTDIHDYDEDGVTTDTIMRFSQWYTERVDALAGEATALASRIDGFISEVEYFAEGADEFRQTFTEDATRPLVVEGEEDEDEETPFSPAGSSGEFTALLQDLDNEDIQVSFWKPGADSEQNTDQVDELSENLNAFYLWALGEQGGLLQQDFDMVVRMHEMWMPQLYDPQEGEAWYDTWEDHADKIGSWKFELDEVDEELEEMIEDETDPAREDYLRDLQDRTTSAIRTLDSFQAQLRDFNIDILVFHNQSDPASKGRATYSWHDSLGWHHVRVEVSNFSLPWLKVKYKRMKIKMKLKNYSGDVTVKVTRYDENTAASFARRGSTPLWKFRYTRDAQAADRINPSNPEQALDYGIKSEARADYTYDRLPRLLGVK